MSYLEQSKYIRYEEYTPIQTIPFRYILNTNEKQKLANIIHSVLHRVCY